MKKIKNCCIFFLAMLPVTAISFAAQSSLSIDQIRGGNAADAELQNSLAESGGGIPTGKESGIIKQRK